MSGLPQDDNLWCLGLQAGNAKEKGEPRSSILTPSLTETWCPTPENPRNCTPKTSRPDPYRSEAFRYFSKALTEKKTPKQPRNFPVRADPPTLSRHVRLHGSHAEDHDEGLTAFKGFRFKAYVQGLLRVLRVCGVYAEASTMFDGARSCTGSTRVEQRFALGF